MPDTSSTELERILASNPLRPMTVHPGIEAAKRIGVRNHEWLKLINSARAPGEKLSFTSPETMRGVPIESPVEYSPGIIENSVRDLESQLPEVMRNVLFKGEPFTPQAPLNTDDYLSWGRKVDVVYQTALRWELMEPYLFYLARERRRDVRGFYFLSRLTPEVRRAKLARPGAWDVDENGIMRAALSAVCLNQENSNLSGCRTRIDQAVAAGQDLNPLYDEWEPGARENWDAFFLIDRNWMREDLDFAAPELLRVPFRDPRDPVVEAFLRDNIEDEWRLKPWRLQLSFTPDAAIHIRFLPGVTPHVDDLGGDEITMDANQPLTEYDVQWTIRHEFGHALGLPDCYVEFYDGDRAVMITYQLDIENLMCSRAGHIKPVHVEELRKYRPTGGAASAGAGAAPRRG
jgi:hypothetical protein